MKKYSCSLDVDFLNNVKNDAKTSEESTTRRGCSKTNLKNRNFCIERFDLNFHV